MKKFLSILLAVMMVLSSTVSYAAPSLAGISETASETVVPVIEETNEETAELSAVDTTQYGELVAEINFDLLTADETFAPSDVVNGGLYSAVGGAKGSGDHMYSSAGDPFFHNTGGGTATVRQKATGDNYLELTGVDNTNFAIRSSNGHQFANRGHYVVTIDVLTESSTKPFEKFQFKDSSSGTSYSTITFEDVVNVADTVTPGEWSTIVVSYDDTVDTHTVNSLGDNNYYPTSVNWLYAMCAVPSTEKLCVDNYRVYWVPEEITHKVTHTSYTGDIEVAEADTVIGGGIKTVEEIGLAFESYTNDGYFIDKLIMDGVEYVSTDKIDLTSSKTFTIVWDRLNILTEYSSEFNGANDINLIQSYTRLPAPTYTDSYANFALTDNAYNFYFVVPGLGGEKTADDDIAIPVGALDRFEMKVRFTGVPDESVTFTAYNNTSQTFNPATGYQFTVYWTNSSTTTIGDNNTTTSKVTIGAVEDEWVVLSLSGSDLGNDADVISGMRIQGVFPLPSGVNMDIDYIRFIGEDLPNVIVDMSSNPDAGKFATKYDETTTVADVLADIDYVGNKVVSGLASSEGGEALSEDTLISSLGADGVTLYALWEVNPMVGDYGELVFELNFDNVSAGDEASVNLASYSVNPLDLGFITNPDHSVSTFTDMYFQTHGSTTSTTYQPATYAFKEDSEHGTYLEYVVNTSNAAYTLWLLSTKTNSTSNTQFFTDKDGYYIVTYDVKVPSTHTGNPHRPSFHHNGVSENDGEVVSYPTPGEWGEVVVAYDDDNIGNSSHSTKITSITMINQLKLFGTVAQGSTVMMDNIRLWWVPKTVDITVAAGENTSVSDTVYTINPAETTVADLMEMVYGNRRTISGLSTTEGGELLSEDTLLSYAYPTTLYASWGPEIDTLEDFSLEFDEATSISDGTAEFMLRDNTYVTWNEDGYMTMHFEAADGYTGVYDNYIYNRKISTTNYISAGSVDQIAVRVRFHGLTAGTYSTSNKGDQTLNLSGFSSCLHIWDTAGSNLTTTNWASSLNGSFENDKWYTLYFDADTCMPYGAGQFRLDTPYPMPDGASVDIDYIRFLPTNSYTLTVDNGENTSATVVTMTGYPGTTVAEVFAKVAIDQGDKKLVGLSRTAGGSVLPTSEVICTTGEDTTLYAIWEDYEYLEGYGYEFDVLPFDSNVITNDAVRTLTVQDGYITIDLTSPEGYTGVWDTQFYLPMTTNNSYNPDKYIPSGVVTNITARIRFRGTGTEAQSLTTTNKNGATGTFDPANPSNVYIHWGAPGNDWGTGLTSYNYNYTSITPDGIVDGRWFTINIPTTSSTTNLNLYDNGVGYLRFDTPYPVPSGTKIDVDFIRLVGDNDLVNYYDGVGEYGEKVWELNFDEIATGTQTFSKTPVHDIGAVFNPAFNAAVHQEGTCFTVNGATSEIVAESDGTGNYLKYTATSAGTNAFMYVRNHNDAPYVLEDGYFVVTYDVINETSAAVPHTFRINMLELVEDKADNIQFIENGDWQKAVVYYDDEIGSTTTDADGQITSTSDITNIKWHNLSTVQVGETVCIDNVTLWYVPKTVPVVIDNSAIGEDNTIIQEYPTKGMTNEELTSLLPVKEGVVFNGLSKTAGGEIVYENRSPVSQMLYSVWAVDTILTVDMGDNTKLENMTIQIPAGSSMKVSDIEAKFIDHGDKIFAGLSLTEGGTKLASTDTIAATESGALTIYALWDDYYTNDFYSVEFDHNGEGVVTTAGEGKLSAGKNSVYWSGAKDASGNATAGDPTDALVWNEDEGYVTMNFVASEYAKAQATANGYDAVVWDPFMEIDSLYDATGDATYLPAGDADYVVVRMRYRGMPAADTVYWDANNGGTRTIKPSTVFAPYYYYTTTAEANFGSPSKDLYQSVAEGSAYRENWFTVFVKASDLGIDASNVYRFRIDPNDGMPDGSAIDIDFIRFVSVSKDYEGPVSREDRTSVRVADEASDTAKYGESRNGIRVLGQIGNTVRDESVELGWMFTSSARWNASSTDGSGSRSWYELKMDLYDASSSFILAGYTRLDSELQIRSYFEEDDFITAFTAVLYGIPVKNYKSPFIVRPFAKVDNAYAYGEPFEINFLGILEAAANSEDATEEVVAYYNACQAEYAAYLDALTSYDSDTTNAQLATLMSSRDTVISNLIIPTNDTAPTVSGSIVTMKAWMDGSLQTVTVSTKNAYPALLTEDNMISEAYAEKPCVYYLQDGIYYIKSLGRSTDAGGNYVGIEKTDSSAMVANTDASALFLSEITDGNVTSPFQRLPIDDELTNGKDSFFLGDFATGKFDFTFQRANSSTRTISTGKTGIIASDSVVVAKYNFPDGTTEWVSYSVDQLLKMGLDSSSANIADGIDFTNLTYVVSNNTTSITGVNQREYEDLALLVGEVDVPATVASSTTNFLAAKYNKVIVKTTSAASYVTVKFTRADGVSDSIKYYAYGTTTDGYRLFDVDLYGMAKYHSTITSLTVTANSGSVSYAYLVEDPDYYSSADLASMAQTMIFQDMNYDNGFYVRDLDQKLTKSEYVNYKFASNGNTPLWMIDPWYAYDYSGTKSDYELYTNASETATSLSDTAGSKVVKFNGTKTSTYADGSSHTGDVLSLTLNARAIYNGMTHTEMQSAGMTYWPHLLIEQNTQIASVDTTATSAGSSKIFLEMDIKMTDYTVDKDGWFDDVGTKQLSFLLYSYLRPKASPNDRIWFGASLCAEGATQYPTWNRDTGASAYIYCIPQEIVYQGIANSFYQQIEDEITETSWNGSGTDSTSKDWVHISLDVTPYIQTAIDWANREDAFGLGTLTRDDFYFDGVNIGFETHGNIDGTFEIANFNFVAYN